MIFKIITVSFQEQNIRHDILKIYLDREHNGLKKKNVHPSGYQTHDTDNNSGLSVWCAEEDPFGLRPRRMVAIYYVYTIIIIYELQLAV